jgi:exodeoxyribonuclease V alpha subunit
MPLHTQHCVMLQRNLLYTGLTRGRKLVIIIGTRKALAMAVKATGAAKRFTGLEERLSLR